jgi:hypothetical protein
MPALSNPRHEAFALALFEGVSMGRSQGASWTAAGYTANPTAAKADAHRALKSQVGRKILARVAELQAHVAKDKRVTVATVLDELAEAKVIAEAERQPSAMVAASMGRAKVAGLLVERSETGGPGDFSAAHTPEEIAERLLEEFAPGSHHSAAQRQAVVTELLRHSNALTAIATDNKQGQRH